MMQRIILTTTPSFSSVVERTALKTIIAERGFSVALLSDIKPPFAFDRMAVAAIVAGERTLGAIEMNYFPNLKVIARFGIGVDNVDLAAAKQRSITFTNVPGGNQRAVAEMAVALILALARNIVGFTAAVKSGRWERAHGSDIRGKTLGVIGLGNIGREAAALAAGIGMKVRAFDTHADAAFAATHGIALCDLPGLYAQSDFITVHVPLNPQTHCLINARAIALMKPGVFIVNTARGAVIDEAALLAGLNSGRVAGAGLDVFSEEPPFENPVLRELIAHPRVIATPHVASFTPATHEAVGARVWHNIAAVLDGRRNEADIVA